MPRPHTLAVVFGDHLDPSAPLLQELDKRTDVVLMAEVTEESTHVPSSKQRTAFFLSAMRHHARLLKERGYRVRYVGLDDPGNTQSLSGEVARAVRELRPTRLLVAPPGEHRIQAMVESWRRTLAVGRVEVADDGHFYTGIEEFDEWAAGRKQLRMETFYRWQRKRLRVLMDDRNEPTGGQWNFDRDNRAAFETEPRPPEPYTPRVDRGTREVLERVERTLPGAPGRLDTFVWPVTPQQAKRALARFVEQRLPRFGRFQDAMWTGQPWLYHSHLSPLLNVRMLDPRRVVQAALDAYERGDAPLQSVEGFVRQILGWREFIRGVYWREGRGYGERNALEQHGTLPSFYWTGETDMACMRDSIGQVLDHGYGHHIQRLMVTGNFALIAGVHPRAISDWYLGMYVDAVDWVTLPNTLGMTMYADGGVVGSKPYAASGKYIQRMSNYCAHCPYDVRQRTGPRACPFNTFYWEFLLRNRTRLGKNPRMAMIVKNVDRLPAAERKRIAQHADRLRVRFGIEDRRAAE
jgi:deoxyribodipyrimidine photolyase-related protein